jgi:hypothetical protein
MVREIFKAKRKKSNSTTPSAISFRVRKSRRHDQHTSGVEMYYNSHITIEI